MSKKAKKIKRCISLTTKMHAYAIASRLVVVGVAKDIHTQTGKHNLPVRITNPRLYSIRQCKILDNNVGHILSICINTKGEVLLQTRKNINQTARIMGVGEQIEVVEEGVFPIYLLKKNTSLYGLVCHLLMS